MGMQEAGEAWSLSPSPPGCTPSSEVVALLPWKHRSCSLSQCPALPALNSEPERLFTPNLALEQITGAIRNKNQTMTITKNPETIRMLRKVTVSVPFGISETPATQDRLWPGDANDAPLFPYYLTNKYFSGTWGTSISGYL